MSDVRTLTPDELVEHIRAKLEARPFKLSYSDYSLAPSPTERAAYTLIVGAGFSHDVVPLVSALMCETIGGYYYPDQDGSSLERPASVLRKDSANFWAEFNKAAVQNALPVVEVDRKGLPVRPGAAYQNLFTYQGANVLFALRKPRGASWLDRIKQQRESPEELRQEPQDTGERFMKGFLRYVLDPGSESGYGSTGRSDLNLAHIYLAALLEVQQVGWYWKTCAFCRTIVTTNFDTLLQNAFQMVSLLYSLTDRPEKGLDRSEFLEEEAAIHLVYTHGSILRHNPASTTGELDHLSSKNVDVLRTYLEPRDVIIIGYGGWNDGLMAALRGCDPSQHKVYWCDVSSNPARHVADFLSKCADGAAYVCLGEGGADGFMRALYQTLVPEEARRDPMQRYRDWRALTWNR
jgi:hypothetical protein